MKSTRDLLFSALLLGVTLVWGWTFPAVKQAVATYGVIAFLATPFALAAVVVAPVGVRRATRASWVTGGAIGLVLAAAYAFQTFGIRATTATNSGLITGLFVVFAPVWNRIIFGVRAGRVFAVAALISLCGLALLTGAGPVTPTVGDLLTLCCAVCFGLHIALLDHYAARHDESALALAQLAVAAAVFLMIWPVTHPLVLPTSATVWQALVVTGVIASAAAFWIQTAAQRRLPATHVTMILTMEPVFAAMFGRLLAGDRLTAVQVVGASLMVAALLAWNVHRAGAFRANGEPAPPDDRGGR